MFNYSPSDKHPETRFVGPLENQDRQDLNEYGLEIPSTVTDAKVKISYEEWNGDEYVTIASEYGWSDDWGRESDGLDWEELESKLDEMEQRSENKRQLF